MLVEHRRRRTSTTSRRNDVPGATERERGYWRDVGTLDAYYDAHMDLVSSHPVFNLYNQEWPIHTLAGAAAAGEVRRRGGGPHRQAIRLDGLRRRRSSRVDACAGRCSRPACTCTRTPRSTARCCMHGVEVGRGAVVRNAILDKNVRIAPGAQIGVDLERPTASASSSPTAASS